MPKSPRERQILKSVGLKLRQVRSKKNLTQERVASEAGLSRNYYNEVENGLRNVTVINLYRILSALKVEDSNDVINAPAITAELVATSV